MITMNDIAEKAGVSRTTVSFVLNRRCHRDQRISESVQKRVLDTAKKLGYIRNDLVLSMVTGRSHAIGIVADFKDFMFPIIRGYAQEAQNHGYSIRLFQVADDLESALTKAIQARVDAIVCLGVSNAAAKNIPERFFNMGIPITGISGTDHPGHSSFDQQGSAAAMTEYLVQCGYRKIICYGGNYRRMPQREAGYREVMKKHHLPPTVVKFDEAAPDDLIDEKPDAVFCGDDYLACRLLQTAYRRGIVIPEVFGVAGFGNTSAGQYSSPALTTVDEPYFDNAVISVRRIIFRLEGKNIPESAPVIGKIIVRDSTKNMKVSRRKRQYGR
ncbi:MAG: LacI family DNA-binding transcriptional regulator [Lentisphaeria bacterium]|nr:LacI family DNA-binding transcriptional regulator [Lentisphaeria bacterium]